MNIGIFRQNTVAKLLEVKRWDLPDGAVEKLLPDLIAGNAERFIEGARAAREK